MDLKYCTSGRIIITLEIALNRPGIKLKDASDWRLGGPQVRWDYGMDENIYLVEKVEREKSTF